MKYSAPRLASLRAESICVLYENLKTTFAACCSMRDESLKCRSLAIYMAPMQLVAPRAVTIAVAILAIICTCADSNISKR